MALTTLFSLTPPIKCNRGVGKPLCLLFTEANLSGAALRRAMTVEPGTRSLALFFFSLSFFPFLATENRLSLPISSFLKRCCDSQGIQFTVVKAYLKLLSTYKKDNIKLDNNRKSYEVEYCDD